jgi:hypothetical protein
MEQYSKIYIPYTGGCKLSPASPASPALSAWRQARRVRAASHSLGSLGRSQSTLRRPFNGQRFRPCYRPDQAHPERATHPPDPITLCRVSHLLAAVRPLLGEEITTAWLARTLVRFDGGPMLDPPRLGPALRTLGFRPMRRRRGSRRRSTWLVPGTSTPRVGRPSKNPRRSHVAR